MTLIMNLENLQQENGTLLMTKLLDHMEEEMKMIQLLNLRQKLLNQIFVITQMHILRCIYSCDRRYKSYIYCYRY